MYQVTQCTKAIVSDYGSGFGRRVQDNVVFIRCNRRTIYYDVLQLKIRSVEVPLCFVRANANMPRQNFLVTPMRKPDSRLVRD